MYIFIIIMKKKYIYNIYIYMYVCMYVCMYIYMYYYNGVKAHSKQVTKWRIHM